MSSRRLELGPERLCSVGSGTGAGTGAAAFVVSSKSQSVKVDSKEVYDGLGQRAKQRKHIL
jgi:hypothetical protein